MEKIILWASGSWWIERDNLDDWSLYWHTLIIIYILAIGIIIGGFILLLTGYVLIQHPSNY